MRGPLRDALGHAAALRASYVEVYEDDALNPSLREDLERAAADWKPAGEDRTPVEGARSKHAREKGVRTDPCAEDAARLCPGMRPGDGRLGACLGQARDEVSPACREFLSKVRR